MSVVLTEDEWRVVQKLANHESLRLHYGGNQSDLLRHGIYWLLVNLEPMVTDPFLEHTMPKLVRALQHDNLLAGKEAIQEELDSLSNRTLDLLDYGEIDGALAEYDAYLDRVAALPPHWRRVAKNLTSQHMQMERFFSAVEKQGLEFALQLKAIMEKER